MLSDLWMTVSTLPTLVENDFLSFEHVLSRQERQGRWKEAGEVGGGCECAGNRTKLGGGEKQAQD